MNSTHNEGLYLLNELLRNGYTEDSLPLPQGKLKAIEERDEELTQQDLTNLRRAYNNNHSQSKA